MFQKYRTAPPHVALRLFTELVLDPAAPRPHHCSDAGSQQLVGVKAFPISLLLTKESQNNYYHGDLDVLYVIAPHLPLSPCLISCQRLIAAEKPTCAQHDPRNTRGPVHPCSMLRTRWRSNLLQIRVENWVDQLCVGHLICGWQLGSPDTGRPRCR